MAELLRGAPVAARIIEDVAARAKALVAQGVEPTLVVVRVGARPDDLSYERGLEKRAMAAGVRVEKVVLPGDASSRELVRTVERVNEDPCLHGCLVFRPLPAGCDEAAVCAALNPAKDVDGITPGSLYGVFADAPVGFAPCTAEAVLATLDHHEIGLAGRRVCVVGRSLVVGRPLAMLLQARDATVTMCHSRTRNLDATCRSAEVLVVAAGRAGLVGADATAPGQVVLDVGINWDEEAGRLRGDVAFDDVEPTVAAITPVPGGIGAVTTAVLMRHVVEAAERTMSA